MASGVEFKHIYMHSHRISFDIEEFTEKLLGFVKTILWRNVFSNEKQSRPNKPFLSIHISLLFIVLIAALEVSDKN